MTLEEKVYQINQKLKNIDINKKIVVWCAGVHTEELFKYTSLLIFPNLQIVDKNKNGTTFYGIKICSREDISWEEIDYVVISSFKYQNEIFYQIKNNNCFKGEIITLYNEDDKSEFYYLNDCNENKIKWSGCYSSWAEAKCDAKGYEDKNILKNVCEATKKIIGMDVGFERDSVIFDYNDYSYLLLTFIAFCATCKSKVHIADFGGSLGTLFWRNRRLFLEMDNLDIEWSVIEQKHFVDCGRENFNKEKGINYYYSLSELKEKPDIILFSGVLQYIDGYEQIIEMALSLKPKYIIIDRTYFAMHEKICVQSVPESIYESSYPIRFFAKEQFVKLFTDGYSLLVDGTVEKVSRNFYADGERCCEGFLVFKLV